VIEHYNITGCRRFLFGASNFLYFLRANILYTLYYYTAQRNITVNRSMTFRSDDWPVCHATYYYTHRRIRYDGWTWIRMPTIMISWVCCATYYYYNSRGAMWHRRTGKCSCQKVTNWRRVHAAVSLSVGFFFCFFPFFFFVSHSYRVRADCFFRLIIVAVYCYGFFPPSKGVRPALRCRSIGRVTRSGEIDRENCCIVWYIYNIDVHTNRGGRGHSNDGRADSKK